MLLDIFGLLQGLVVRESIYIIYILQKQSIEIEPAWFMNQELIHTELTSQLMKPKTPESQDLAFAGSQQVAYKHLSGAPFLQESCNKLMFQRGTVTTPLNRISFVAFSAQPKKNLDICPADDGDLRGNPHQQFRPCKLFSRGYLAPIKPDVTLWLNRLLGVVLDGTLEVP